MITRKYDVKLMSSKNTRNQNALSTVKTMFIETTNKFMKNPIEPSPLPLYSSKYEKPYIHARSAKTLITTSSKPESGLRRIVKFANAKGVANDAIEAPLKIPAHPAAIAKPATRNSAYDEDAMADYKDGTRALMVEQLNNTAVPRPRTPSYATFSSAYAEAMTNILSDAATNGEVDDDYIQSELDTVAETFTEDYDTYYAE